MRTRSMSVAGAPSDSPKSSVARRCPPSGGLRRIITRSISKNLDKRKSCLLPLTCPSLAASLSGCPRIQNMLKKQHQSVLDYINRDRTGEPKGFRCVNPNTQVIHASRIRLSDEDRHQSLVQLGVVFRGQNRPLPARKVKQAEKTLNLRMMNNAGDRLLSALTLPRYYGVEHIDLTSAKDIEDKHLKLLKTKQKVVASLERVQSLNLDHCNISSKGVQDLISSCPRLKKLSIGENLRVTDFCINVLVKNCKSLTDLTLSGCKNITDKSLVTIKNACHGLESLDITRCERLTDDGVIAIAEGCPGLKFLSLSEIPGVTNTVLDTLSELFPNLQ